MPEAEIIPALPQPLSGAQVLIIVAIIVLAIVAVVDALPVRK